MLVLLLFVVLGLSPLALALQLVLSVLLQNFEATAKTLALFANEDSLLVVNFLVEGLGLSGHRSVRNVRVELLLADRRNRLPRQMKSA